MPQPPHHTPHPSAAWRGGASAPTHPGAPGDSPSAAGEALRRAPVMPLVGITADITHPPDNPASIRATCPLTYSRAVSAAGGMPLILPPLRDCIADQVRRCDAFVLTGGDDPRTEPFGEPTHPQACPIHPLRQEYETELLRALLIAGKPVLGICLGMQMMALVAGGRINQHLPDSVPTARDHRAEDAQQTGREAMHAIVPDLGAPACPATRLLNAATGGCRPPHVASRHHQAVSDPGSLRVIARAHDGVIEAVTDPSRPYYIGVQWHPERTEHPALGLDLFRALVQAASGARPGAAPA